MVHVSDSNLPPEQWRPLFDAIGVEFGYRPLASHTGMNHTRLRRLLLGGGTTDDAVRQVAEAFRVPVTKILELRGQAEASREPFTLPDDAGRLNERERDVIRSMVRVLLDAGGERDDMETEKEPDAQTESGQGQEARALTKPLTTSGDLLVDALLRSDPKEWSVSQVEAMLRVLQELQASRFGALPHDRETAGRSAGTAAAKGLRQAFSREGTSLKGRDEQLKKRG